MTLRQSTALTPSATTAQVLLLFPVDPSASLGDARLLVRGSLKPPTSCGKNTLDLNEKVLEVMPKERAQGHFLQKLYSEKQKRKD